MSRLVTKPTKWHVHPVKTQISLGIHPVWSESLFAWRKHGSLATHWAHSEDSQIGLMPRLIWVFAGCTSISLVLSRCGSHVFMWDGRGVLLKLSVCGLAILKRTIVCCSDSYFYINKFCKQYSNNKRFKYDLFILSRCTQVNTPSDINHFLFHFCM